MTQQLLTALHECIELLRVADCSSGCCMCGSPVSDHGVADNHGPVDDGEYRKQKVLDRAYDAIYAYEVPTTTLWERVRRLVRWWRR